MTKNTEVAQWLKRIDAEDYATIFHDGGYSDIQDIDADDIKRLFEDKPPGIIKRIIRQLANEQVKQSASSPAPEIPKLPENKSIDLSRRSVNLDGLDFPIPTSVPVTDKGEVFSPHELSPEHWITIARNTHCLYGKVIGDKAPRDARKPVLHWLQPENDDYVLNKVLSGSVRSEVRYTNYASNMAKAGFHAGSASFSAPFASGSASYENSEKRARAATSKTLYMTGIWDFPRAQLYLNECTVVSDEFKKAVTQAISETKTAKAKLQQVFNTYGHIIGYTVDLGARLYFTHREKASGSVDEAEKHERVSAALAIKTFSSSASASYTGEQSSANMQQAMNMSKSVNFRARGGDTTLANNPAAWAASVKNPNLWAPIRYYDVCRTIDLLDEKTRKQVEGIWGPASDSPLHGSVFHIQSACAINHYLYKQGTGNVQAGDLWTKSNPKFISDIWKFTACNDLSETGIYWIQNAENHYLYRDTSKSEVQLKEESAVDQSNPLGGNGVYALWRVYPANEADDGSGDAGYIIETFQTFKISLCYAGGNVITSTKDKDKENRGDMWYLLKPYAKKLAELV